MEQDKQNRDTAPSQTPQPSRPGTLMPPTTSAPDAPSMAKARRLGLACSLSSFSKAVYRVEESVDVLLPRNLSKLKLNEGTKTEMKEDLKLVEEVKHESVMPENNHNSTTDAAPIETSSSPLPTIIITPTMPKSTIAVANRYSLWECGFDLINSLESDPAAIIVPENKADFLKAVQGEIHTVTFIQNGLSKYMDAINSGKHHVFSESFIRKQNTATQLTLGQLFQIKQHLEEVVVQLGKMEENDDDAGNEEIVEELKELFRHAKPWIARTRAVLVSSHVFYKVNYALAADARKNAKPID